jgi:ABC-type sugar transport system permease subunit
MSFRKQQGIMLILPAILVMGLFTAYPLLEGLRVAFTNKHLLKEGVQYIGIQNFIRLASDWNSDIRLHGCDHFPNLFYTADGMDNLLLF